MTAKLLLLAHEIILMVCIQVSNAQTRTSSQEIPFRTSADPFQLHTKQ